MENGTLNQRMMAEYLGISVKKAREMMNEEGFPWIARSGERLVLRSDLNQWLGKKRPRGGE